MRGCEINERRISACGDGELSAEYRAELQRHLARCPRCRARFTELERLNGVLGSAFALPVEPDAGLPDLVMAALSREPRRPVRRQPFFAPLTPRLASAFAGAMILIAALATGAQSWRASNPPDSPSFAQSPFRNPIVPRNIHDKVKTPIKGLHRPLKPTNSQTPDSTPAHPPSHASVELPQMAAVPALPSLTVPDAAPHKPTLAKADLPRKRTQPITAIRPLIKPVPRTSSDQKPETGETAPYLASARLQQVAGVALTRDDNTGWCNIPPDTAVRVDQRVRSGQASQVALSLGGVELRMNEETEVIPVRAPQSDAPYWVVRLINGELFAKVPKGAYGLKVMTPAGDATSKGGEFIVRANDLFETRLLIAKGAASLENEGGRSPGFEGMQISSRLGAPPDLAQPSVDPNAFQWAYAPMRDDLFHRPD
jgi:ferric-dicitrate binding protein FerR (iron transport regulator)